MAGRVEVDVGQHRHGVNRVRRARRDVPIPIDPRPPGQVDAQVRARTRQAVEAVHPQPSTRSVQAERHVLPHVRPIRQRRVHDGLKIAPAEGVRGGVHDAVIHPAAPDGEPERPRFLGPRLARAAMIEAPHDGRARHVQSIDPPIRHVHDEELPFVLAQVDVPEARLAGPGSAIEVVSTTGRVVPVRARVRDDRPHLGVPGPHIDPVDRPGPPRPEENRACVKGRGIHRLVGPPIGQSPHGADLATIGQDDMRAVRGRVAKEDDRGFGVPHARRGFREACCDQVRIVGVARRRVVGQRRGRNRRPGARRKGRGHEGDGQRADDHERARSVHGNTSDGASSSSGRPLGRGPV